jgi:hypothetical protein
VSIRPSILVVVAIAACSGATDAPTAHGIDSPPPLPVPAAVASITLTPISDLAVGDSVRVTATPRDATGALLSRRAVMWTSNNPGVASVDSTGMVRALLPGTVTITATIDGLSASENANTYELVVSSLVIAPPTDTLFTERHIGLFVTARDQFGRQFSGTYSVKWTSSDLTVATVDTTGRVTAVAPGSSTITASVNAVSAASVITVVTAPPTSDMLGDWTMTMSPSPSCRDRFPAIAQTRIYTVRFSKPYTSNEDFQVDITGASVVLINPGRAWLKGTTLTVEIPGDTQYSGWASGSLTVRLSTTESLNIWGGVTGDISGPQIHATMTGEIDYWSPGADLTTGPTVVCAATDHVVTLYR